MTTPKWLTTSEAAIWLGVNLATVRRWVKLGYLPHWRTPGGHCRFDPDELDAWLERRREA